MSTAVATFGVDRAPSMKLHASNSSIEYRRKTSYRRARRTLNEKKEVRSSILASLDRQISYLEPEEPEQDIQPIPLVTEVPIEEATNTDIHTTNTTNTVVPFESVLSQQVFTPQSHRQTPPRQKQNKRISERSSRILESLDKHIGRDHEEEEEEVEEVLQVKSAPSTPKRPASSPKPSPSTLPKRKPKRISPKSKKLSRNPRKSSRMDDSSSRRSSMDSSKQSLGSRRSSMDNTIDTRRSSMDTSMDTRRSSMDSTKQSYSTTTTSTTIPQHLQPSSEDALASVWDGDDDDVAIGNLTPMKKASKNKNNGDSSPDVSPSSSMENDDEDNEDPTATPNTRKQKRKKKKKGTKRRGSNGGSSKRSLGSSSTTFSTIASTTTNGTRSQMESSFDKSLASTSIEMTIEEEPATASARALVEDSSKHRDGLTRILSKNKDVAIGNLMPGGGGGSKARHHHHHAAPPSPTSPDPSKRTSDNSLDSEDQFEHFYQEPIQRSSIVSTMDAANAAAAAAANISFDEEEEEEEEEHTDIDVDLLEASMSLSDIFGNLGDSSDVAIANLTPAKPPAKKEELTARPRASSVPKQRSQRMDEDDNEPTSSTGTPKSSKKKSRWSLRSQRSVDVDIEKEDQESSKKTSRWSIRSGRTVDVDVDTKADDASKKTSRWSIRSGRTVDADIDKRGSTRSHRTVDSWFNRGGGKEQQPQDDENSLNSQDLASEQRLAAIFGSQGPNSSIHNTPAASPIAIRAKLPPPPPPHRQPHRHEEWTDVSSPQAPNDDDSDEHLDQDIKSKLRLQAIFGEDHELAKSPEPQIRKQPRVERRGSFMSNRSTRSGRSADSKRKQSSFGSLHTRFTNRSGRSKERSIDNNSSVGSLHRSGRSKERSIDASLERQERRSSIGSVFSARSGRSRESSVDASFERQERRTSLGSLHSRMSMKSADSSVKKSKTTNRSKSPLRRFSPKRNRTPEKQRRVPEGTPNSSGGRPLDDDDLIVEGVLKRYNTEQCRTFEDHQEMAEAALISSITNTSPRELRRLKTKLVERLRAQLESRGYRNGEEDESVNDSDHLIEVYDNPQDDPSDVTSLTSLTSFTNFQGGASVKSGSIGALTKSSRTLDRPSNSALNYQHGNQDTELVFVTKVPISGGKYTGTVCPITSQPEGNGRMVYRGSKGVYNGEWKQGQWNGSGKHIKANGDYYDGNFLDNLYHGEGVFSYKESGRFFEGKYVMGERTKGTMRYADGSVYKGQFYHGRRHGRGSYTFKDGSRYKGDFYKDLMQGIGELRFRDGSSYVGEWKRGKHEGQGSMYSPDGVLCWAGMWQDGRQVLDG
ncbi:unnamed protein product [Cylindrotheca closterium]|uniref:Uncharacterized protein n=1 Tax=Cylindrotheca closterium TaxID=2856 RepID=A0AAD2JMH7_9STRA|nr:unnamed protein product [Cylindrotheca closterium]